jgi:hypothetical protein
MQQTDNTAANGTVLKYYQQIHLSRTTDGTKHPQFGHKKNNDLHSVIFFLGTWSFKIDLVLILVCLTSFAQLFAYVTIFIHKLYKMYILQGLDFQTDVQFFVFLLLSQDAYCLVH